MSSRLRPGEEETFIYPDISLPNFLLVKMLISYFAKRFTIKIFGIRKIAMILTKSCCKNVASLDFKKKSLPYCSLIARVMLVTEIPSQKL
jgi:hypothetical protein